MSSVVLSPNETITALLYTDIVYQCIICGMKKNSLLLSEAARIADQLRRAFDGSAWHGPALLELLKDVDAATAAARPLRDLHSIWELVLHIAVWDDAGLRRLDGKKWQPAGLKNFPLPAKPTA